MSEEKKLYTIKKNNLYGFIDGEGTIIAEPIYTKAYEMPYSYGLVEKDGLYGLISSKGDFVLALEYKAITILDKFLFGIKKEEKFALISVDRKQLTGFDYLSIFPFSEGLAAVYKETGFGYLNEKGEKVIPFHFYFANPFHNGIAVVILNNKCGLIDQQGQFVQKPKYDWCRAYKNCYHVNIGGKISDDECYGGKSGLLSLDGREITPLIFDDLDGFMDGLSHVRQGDLFGEINEAGELTNPIIFNQRVRFSDGLGAVQKDNKYGYVDLQNQLVIPYQYNWAGNFNQGVADVRINEKVGFINKQGDFVRELENIKLLSIREGSWEFFKDGKFGLMNHNGTITTPYLFESITNFYSCGLAWAKQDGLYGIVNKKFEFVFPASLDLKTLYPISTDFIHIEVKGKHGLLSSSTFEWVIPMVYNSIGVFEGSLVELKCDGKLSYANRMGKVVWQE